MAKLDVKLGKSAGQKANEKEAKAIGDGKRTTTFEDPYGSGMDITEKTGKFDELLYRSGSPKKKRDADKANKKAANKLSKDAKAGKEKARKALNVAGLSDERLDEVLNASSELENRRRKREGTKY